MQTVVICSRNPIKMDAVACAFRAFGLGDSQWIGLDCPSGVPDQPLADDTMRGALNRALHARRLYPDAMIVSMENGLFERPDGHFDDKAAVVVILPDGATGTVYSDAVVIDRKHTIEAIARGITIGRVMMEKGIVKDHADPHADLIGTPRAQILRHAVERALKSLIAPTAPAKDGGKDRGRDGYTTTRQP